MPIAPDAVLARNDSLPGTELEGAMVFLSVESGDYLRLDGTARAVWDHLSTPMTVNALLEVLTRTYGIDAATCATDTMPFLEDLVQAGLVVAKSPSP